MRDPGYTYRCKLIRVTDGDTVVLCIDMGLRMTATVPVRLAGINTPELNTQAGKDARDWARTWFETHTDLLVATEKDPEKYGRWLGTIMSRDEVLNDALVAAGHAEPYDARP